MPKDIFHRPLIMFKLVIDYVEISVFSKIAKSTWWLFNLGLREYSIKRVQLLKLYVQLSKHFDEHTLINTSMRKKYFLKIAFLQSDTYFLFCFPLATFCNLFLLKFV